MSLNEVLDLIKAEELIRTVYKNDENILDIRTLRDGEGLNIQVYHMENLIERAKNTGSPIEHFERKNQKEYPIEAYIHVTENLRYFTVLKEKEWEEYQNENRNQDVSTD